MPCIVLTSSVLQARVTLSLCSSASAPSEVSSAFRSTPTKSSYSKLTSGQYGDVILKLKTFSRGCLLCFRAIADNRVFFQHPDLMRALGIHETVMQLMVNTLNRQTQTDTDTSADVTATSNAPSKDPIADMVVACCRFLCYFCRTGSKNQSAIFEHLSYLLENSCMLLCKPPVVAPVLTSLHCV